MPGLGAFRSKGRPCGRPSSSGAPKWGTRKPFGDHGQGGSGGLGLVGRGFAGAGRPAGNGSAGGWTGAAPRPVDPRFAAPHHRHHDQPTAAPVLARIGPERGLGYRGAVRSGRRSGRSDKRCRIRSNPAVKEYSVKLAAGRADGSGLTRTSTPWPGRPTATDSCRLLIFIPLNLEKQDPPLKQRHSTG
jgi:hypothetical protein